MQRGRVRHLGGPGLGHRPTAGAPETGCPGMLHVACAVAGVLGALLLGGTFIRRRATD